MIFFFRPSYICVCVSFWVVCLFSLSFPLYSNGIYVTKRFVCRPLQLIIKTATGKIDKLIHLVKRLKLHLIRYANDNHSHTMALPVFTSFASCSCWNDTNQTRWFEQNKICGSNETKNNNNKKPTETSTIYSHRFGENHSVSILDISYTSLIAAISTT